MDFYIHLAWPQEWLLRLIIVALWILAVYVSYKCFDLRKRIASNLDKIEELGNTQRIAYLENSLKLNNISYEATFAKFESDNGKNDDNALVFEHLRAIFDAGRKSSRLDADLLVKNTIDKICTDVDTIKSCISVFLVIGILGTLIGLGISIGSFNGDSFIINAQANNTAKELSKLFGNLRGAFAPSMWGVFLTISFVILYTMVIQERCINKLTDKLTTNTIKVWLPALYPTDFQKGENTMVQLKETIQNAEGINNSANELLDNLSMANATVQSINDVSTAISSSVNKFEEGSNKVVALKDSIEALSVKIADNDSKHLEWVNNAIAQTNSFQNESKKNFLEQAAAVRENFAVQSEQLKQIINTLKMYDDNALKSQDELNKKLAESIKNNMQAANEMQVAIGELANRNKEVVTAIGSPLNQQLTTMSDRLSESLKTMTAQLLQLKASMDRIDSPLQTTAGEIQLMFGNMLAKLDQVLAAKGGLDPEAIELLKRNAANNTFSDDSKMEQQLEAILKCLEKNTSKDNSFVQQIQPKETGLMATIKDYMPIAVGVLLAISIVVQCVMVSRIGALEQSQNAVNQVLLKGDKINK